ncbi:cutinase family protein [Prescottella equi]
MRRIAAVLAAVALLTGLTLNTASAATPPSCEDVAVFGLGGHGDPKATVYGEGIHRVEYSAVISPLQAGGPYDRSVAQGRDNMVAAVDEYAARCDGPIIVKGYSQGARAAGDALEVLQDRDYAVRVSGHLYADPKHPGGIEDALKGFSVWGVSMTGPRGGFKIPVTSECNPNDAICDLPFPKDIRGSLVNIHGYLTGAHVYDVNN